MTIPKEHECLIVFCVYDYILNLKKSGENMIMLRTLLESSKTQFFYIKFGCNSF